MGAETLMGIICSVVIAQRKNSDNSFYWFCRNNKTYPTMQLNMISPNSTDCIMVIGYNISTNSNSLSSVRQILFLAECCQNPDRVLTIQYVQIRLR